MQNDLCTPAASLPSIANAWAPHVSFVFSLPPSPRREGRGNSCSPGHAAAPPRPPARLAEPHALPCPRFSSTPSRSPLPPQGYAPHGLPQHSEQALATGAEPKHPAAVATAATGQGSSAARGCRTTTCTSCWAWSGHRHSRRSRRRTGRCRSGATRTGRGRRRGRARHGRRPQRGVRAAL
jgi:hypothetical protein